jgi:hypothetical protein
LAHVDGRQPQELPSNGDGNILPSASVLIGVIDGEVTSNTPGFNFMATGYHLMHPPSLERAPNIRETRYFGSLEISDDMLKTLGESRHLHPALVPLAGKLFEREISDECEIANSLLAAASRPSDSKGQCMVANLNWTNLSFADINQTASEVCPASSSPLSNILMP